MTKERRRRLVRRLVPIVDLVWFAGAFSYLSVLLLSCLQAWAAGSWLRFTVDMNRYGEGAFELGLLAFVALWAVHVGARMIRDEEANRR